MAQTVKNLPSVWEIQVRSLGQEDLLEKEMGIHSSILAWRIPWTEEPGGVAKSQLTLSLSVSFFTFYYKLNQTKSREAHLIDPYVPIT